MAIKVGVMGSPASDHSGTHLLKARDLGAAIARHGGITVTGACPELPLAAAEGTKSEGSGTLGDLATAYDEGKLIGVLNGTGGITNIVPDILAACNKVTGARVVYDDDPDALRLSATDRNVSRCNMEISDAEIEQLGCQRSRLSNFTANLLYLTSSCEWVYRNKVVTARNLKPSDTPGEFGCRTGLNLSLLQRIVTDRV